MKPENIEKIMVNIIRNRLGEGKSICLTCGMMWRRVSTEKIFELVKKAGMSRDEVEIVTKGHKRYLRKKNE